MLNFLYRLKWQHILIHYCFGPTTVPKKPTVHRKNFTISIHPERCNSITPVISKAIFGEFAAITNRIKLITIPRKGI